MRKYLKKIVDLYKLQPGRIIILSLLSVGTGFLSILLVHGEFFGREHMAITIGLPILGGLIGMFFQIMFINLAKDPTLSDENLFQIALSRFFPYLGTTILQGLALIGLYLLFLIPGIIFTTRWGFTPYVVATTKKSGFKAINSSAKLVRGNWWNIFGISAGFGFCLGILTLLLVIPFVFIVFATQDFSADQTISQMQLWATEGALAIELFSQVFAALITPLSAFFLFFVYQKYNQQYEANHDTKS
jgi:hypothetical protein